jgi:copper homeostasis protein
VTILVEACVDTMRSVRAALAGGADRLELCADRATGGLTPSDGLIELAREAGDRPLAVMIRPRPGDFLYDADEFDVMRRDIIRCRELGAEAVVLGLLLPDGTVDLPRTAALTALARPMDVVFHRAFDRTPDAEAALESLIAIGIDRVLTSGHAATASEGIPMLARLVARAAGRITMLAGGGVRPENARAIVEGTGVHEIHSSGALPGGETSEEVIRGVVKAVSRKP